MADNHPDTYKPERGMYVWDQLLGRWVKAVASVGLATDQVYIKNSLGVVIDPATEPTLQQVANNTDTVEAKLQSIIDNTSDLELNTDQIEAKLDTLHADVDQVEPKLDTLIAKDFATETTLQQVELDLDAVNLSLTAIFGAVDTVEPSLATLISNTDTLEAKLQSIIDNTDTVEAKLQSLIDLFENQIVVSVNNTTTVALGAGAVFLGVSEEILGFQSLTVTIFGDPRTATGTFQFEFSPDNVNWDTTVPLFIDDCNVVIPIPLRTIARYFRVRYTNGAIAQTAFRLTTLKHRFGSEDLTRTPVQTIGPAEPIKVVRALIEPNFDAASRALLGADREVFGAAIAMPRVNQVQADFSKSLANNSVTSTVTNGGTTAQSSGQATMTSGANVNGTARLQTNKSVRYLPGREIFAVFTARFTVPTSANSHQRAGLFNDTNGFFLGYQGLTFGFTRRSGGVDTFVALTAASGDRLDKTFLSRFSRDGRLEAFDPTKVNVWRIRFGWLGSSVVHFEIQSPDGLWILVHTIKIPNLLTVPSILDPNLPIRMEVVKAAADATSLVIGTGSWAAGIISDPSQFRPSQVSSRTHVDASTTITGAATPASGTIHTVTAGQIFYLTSVEIDIAKILSAGGENTMTDGGSGGTIKRRYQVPTIGSNTLTQVRQTFPEPIPFLVDLTFNVIALGIGANASVNIAGYEEAA